VDQDSDQNQDSGQSIEIDGSFLSFIDDEQSLINNMILPKQDATEGFKISDVACELKRVNS